MSLPETSNFLQKCYRKTNMRDFRKPGIWKNETSIRILINGQNMIINDGLKIVILQEL